LIPDPPWEGLIPDYLRSGAFGCSPDWSSDVIIPKKNISRLGESSMDIGMERMQIFLVNRIKISGSIQWGARSVSY